MRLLYVEMLGHDASFGYMKAVELSASSNLMEKRVSYLCAGLCFAPEHEFRMMLVNRLQRDLQSANVLECAIALSAAAKILTADMIPAVLPVIVNLLKHDQEMVRKKAVMLLHRFLVLQPDSVSHMGDKFRVSRGLRTRVHTHTRTNARARTYSRSPLPVWSRYLLAHAPPRRQSRSARCATRTRR